MIACIPVTADGMADHGWGRARRVAVATTSGDEIRDWQEIDVAWDTLHDQGTEGTHHARVARFLIDHQVEAVLSGHMGPGMVRMLATMGIQVVLNASGDARGAVLSAIASHA
jgi:predicted Fe-Mo cluster-binding NifX family protein